MAGQEGFLGGILEINTPEPSTNKLRASTHQRNSECTVAIPGLATGPRVLASVPPPVIEVSEYSISTESFCHLHSFKVFDFESNSIYVCNHIMFGTDASHITQVQSMR